MCKYAGIPGSGGWGHLSNSGKPGAALSARKEERSRLSLLHRGKQTDGHRLEKRAGAEKVDTSHSHQAFIY